MTFDLLKTLASKYIWWKPAQEAVIFERRLLAQVMNIGTFEDIQAVEREVGEDRLREALKGAECGEFNARSWAYWHYRLGLSEVGNLPAMPERKRA